MHELAHVLAVITVTIGIATMALAGAALVITPWWAMIVACEILFARSRSFVRTLEAVREWDRERALRELKRLRGEE